MTAYTQFPKVPQAKQYLGAAYTGKTQSLLLEIQSLLDEGVDASEILVFCATSDAAQNFTVRLGAQDSNVPEIQVTTPRALFLDLLDSKEAYDAIGRKARLLLPFEYNFLLEDLKTSGILPARLREILKFLYRGLSELADDDKDWLLTKEETELLDLLRECLAFTGAILEPELANLAVAYLRSSEDVLSQARRDYVFVDDFQLLSRASQFAACLLAGKHLCFSANQNSVLEVYESYPYADGIDQFMQANPSTVVTHLNTNYSCYFAAKASSALLEEQGVEDIKMEHAKSEEQGSYQLIEVESPQEEILCVADSIAQSLKQGVLVRDIVVAAPNMTWKRTLLHQLKERGIAAEVLPDAGFLKGDIRSSESSFAARLLTLAALVEDPTDAVAWRSWCGFDDYLAHSNSIRSLRKLRQLPGETLDVVLDRIDKQQDLSDETGTTVGLEGVMRARREALALINKLSALKGEKLLAAIARELAGPVAQVPRELTHMLVGYENALRVKSSVTLAHYVRKCLEMPVYQHDDVVRIASYEKVVGLNPRCLFLIGFMNGFFPLHDYFDGTALTIEQSEKRYAKDLRCLADLVAKASDALVVSYCKKLDLEHAERLKLVIGRIALEDGKRVAKTEASIFLKFMQV